MPLLNYLLVVFQQHISQSYIGAKVKKHLGPVLRDFIDVVMRRDFLIRIVVGLGQRRMVVECNHHKILKIIQKLCKIIHVIMDWCRGAGRAFAKILIDKDMGHLYQKLKGNGLIAQKCQGQRTTMLKTKTKMRKIKMQENAKLD